VETIQILAVAAIPVLGALLWWLFKGKFIRNDQDHKDLREENETTRGIIVDQIGKVVSTNDCRDCRNGTTNAIQAVGIRLSTIQESVADVREKVASGLGTITGKLETVTRMLASRMVVGRKEDK